MFLQEIVEPPTYLSSKNKKIQDRFDSRVQLVCRLWAMGSCPNTVSFVFLAFLLVIHFCSLKQPGFSLFLVFSNKPKAFLCHLHWLPLVVIYWSLLFWKYKFFFSDKKLSHEYNKICLSEEFKIVLFNHHYNFWSVVSALDFRSRIQSSRAGGIIFSSLSLLRSINGYV